MRERVSVAVKVKNSSNGEIRRFRLEEVEHEDLFTTLVSQIRTLYGSERGGRVSYVDVDGDDIAMSHTVELLEAIRCSSSMLTIVWRESSAMCEREQVDGREKEPNASSSSCMFQGRGRVEGKSEGHSIANQEQDCASSDNEEDEGLIESEEPMVRFEKKIAKIEKKIAKLKDSNKSEEKKTRKMEKLQKKLEKTKAKREETTKRLGSRRQEELQKRLRKLRAAKLRNETKQQRIGIILTTMERSVGSSNREKKIETLKEQLRKLEERHALIISAEEKVEVLLDESLRSLKE